MEKQFPTQWELAEEEAPYWPVLPFLFLQAVMLSGNLSQQVELALQVLLLGCLITSHWSKNQCWVQVQHRLQ